MKSSFNTSTFSQPFPDRRLRPGLSLSSYGTNCAAFSGIPQEIIARADYYTQLQSRGEDLVGIIRGESDQQEMKELKVAEEIAKRFVAWDIDVSGDQHLRTELARVLG
jgi:DNA mismatch repair protein MSH5